MMKRAHEILLIAIVLGSLFQASGAESSSHGNLIPRIHKEEDAKTKQAESDVPITTPDVESAQRELESLNNSLSNAMRMAEETKAAEEDNGSVFGKVVFASLILGAGIYLFSKFGPKFGFLYNVSADEADAKTGNLAEEKSFSAFVTAFKVGPTPDRRDSDQGANEFEPLEAGQSRLAAPGPLQVFFDSAPNSVAIMRGLIQEITRATDHTARQNLLVQLCEKIAELKRIAGLPGVLPVWQLAAALEGLVKQLAEKAHNVTPSTLRTVASAVDLLEGLSVPGIESELMSNPPLRLLAVDDDALSRHAVSFALKKALNKPDLAENGEAAMALVSNIRYDAIFLDVQMPGMDGFETCTKIHATELNRATPVVFVTCQSDFDARAKSTLSGGIDLIGKPFLTFEITVKALTIAFRGRLNRRNEPILQRQATGKTEALESSPDMVGKAFLTHAPEHIRTLRTRFDEVGTAKEQERQELLVDLYLAVHSFRAEAELAKFPSVVQLGSAIEARLKRSVEGSRDFNPNLGTVGEGLEMLGNIFASKAGAHLSSESSLQMLSLDEDMQKLLLALATRLTTDKDQAPAAIQEPSPVVDLIAVGK
jgi:DNA-binding response OmpR family regulator